jgi:hypothetical protein
MALFNDLKYIEIDKNPPVKDYSGPEISYPKKPVV